MHGNFECHIVGDGTQPKYIQLANALENWIISGEMTPGTRLPSSRQLSRRLRMTVLTVDKGLEELRQRGLLVRRVGSGTYVAGQTQSLRKLRIGLCCHTPMTQDFCYVSTLTQTLYSYWGNQGYDLISLLRHPHEYEKTLLEYSLSGLIVFDPQEEGVQKIVELRKHNIPIVGVGMRSSESPHIMFGTDYLNTSLSAVAYLTGLGHRRLGIISTLSGGYAVAQREAGLSQGMWEAGLPFNPRWIIRRVPEIPIDEDPAFVAYFQDPQRPTAMLLMAHRDMLPLYHLLQKLNLRIPEDVSLLGFDDPVFAAQLAPPLAVFAQPVQEIASLASEQLLRMISGEEPIPVAMPDSILIYRGSCAPLQE